jgi:hypothetical protein
VTWAVVSGIRDGRALLQKMQRIAATVGGDLIIMARNRMQKRPSKGNQPLWDGQLGNTIVIEADRYSVGLQSSSYCTI